MTHTTASLSCAKVIIVVISWGFFLFQVYHFDRFDCLKLWSSRSKKNGFLRIMTYSYCLAFPLYAIYEGILATIKYDMGSIIIPSVASHEIPVPYQLWPPLYVKLAKMSYWMLAACCGCNTVTAWEEILFWLWLLGVSSHKERFFSTLWFKSFVALSVLSVAVFPVMVFLGGDDPTKMERNVYFALSCIQILVAVGTGIIICRFPRFIRKSVEQGCKPEVVLRLWTFHSLNQLRFACRVLYCILIVPTSDAMAGNHTIALSVVLTDIFQFVAFTGFALGAGIQLLIFFPRPSQTDYEVVEMVPRSQLRSRPGLTTGITADDKSEIFLQSDIGPSASQRGEVIFDERSAHSGLELVDGNASRSSVAFPVPKVELNRIHPRLANYRTPLDIPFDEEDDDDDDF